MIDETRAQLSEEEIEFLHALPATQPIGDVLYCHATPRNDVDIFTERTPEERLAFLFDGRRRRRVVCGHTHTQFERTVAGMRVVNSGSVGMPYEDEPGAYWPLDLEHRRTPYDGAEARRRRARKRSRTSPNVGSELVTVGRVGRPHGVDGAFFVEGPSEREERVRDGRDVLAGGEPAKVVSSRRGSGGRPVIRLDRRVERGAELAVARASLPASRRTSTTSSSSSASSVEEEGGRVLGRVREVLEYPANDVLELDSGVSLPLVEACVR